jgi:7-keto-8-aminopelargonate synthetase-like enzyme
VLVCSDELNHASIIDGCRLARAVVAVYRHNDLEHLTALLRERGARRALVVTDTVFSMDGDIADVDAIIELCTREQALCVFDEAHAVLGPHPHVPSDADVLRIGTLSKTLGALGGFVAGPTRYVEIVENQARPYIFTTAPTPADTAAALAALRILQSKEGDALVTRLRAHVDRIRTDHPSPILPFVIGDERATLDAAAQLLASSCPRSGRRQSRPAAHAFASRFRRRTPTRRSSYSTPRSRRYSANVTCRDDGRRHRHRHRDRQDLRDGRTRA